MSRDSIIAGVFEDRPYDKSTSQIVIRTTYGRNINDDHEKYNHIELTPSNDLKHRLLL